MIIIQLLKTRGNFVLNNNNNYDHQEKRLKLKENKDIILFLLYLFSS